MNTDKRGWLLLCVVGIVGCVLDFEPDFGPLVETTTPTAQQIRRCRSAMYIKPGVVVRPLGYKVEPGPDNAIWLKFQTPAKSIEEVFDGGVVDSATFYEGVSVQGQSSVTPAWWDVGGKTLHGERGSVLTNDCFMDIGYMESLGGGLIVYVAWHEI